MKLAEKKCVPCEGGIDPLNSSEIAQMIKQLNPEWKVVKSSKLFRDFRFVNFVQTMEFVNRIAELAEEEGHHPNIHIGYGECQIELWTHAIDGLSENDFILAAKIDRL